MPVERVCEDTEAYMQRWANDGKERMLDQVQVQAGADQPKKQHTVSKKHLPPYVEMMHACLS